MGTTGFVAQARGAANGTEVGLIFLRVVLLAFVLGMLVTLLSRPLIDLALILIDSSTAVESNAREYATIRAFSAPATLCIFAFTGVLIGLQRAKEALALQLVLNLSNISLDMLFVPVFEMGVPGVAWATLISEYIAMAFGFWLLRDMTHSALQNTSWSAVLEVGPAMKLMKANADIFIRTLCLVFAFAYFTAQGAKLGELYLAVNTILLHFQSMMAYALDGFAFAGEALVGSAYGERNTQRFKKSVRLTTIWMVICAVLIAFVYGLFAQHLIGLFTNQVAVIELALEYSLWLVILPLVSLWSFLLDGIFIGITQTKAMRNNMLISTSCIS